MDIPQPNPEGAEIRWIMMIVLLLQEELRLLVVQLCSHSNNNNNNNHPEFVFVSHSWFLQPHTLKSYLNSHSHLLKDYSMFHAESFFGHF